MGEPNRWFEEVDLGEHCSPDTRCPFCNDNGDCDMCGTINGRWMEAVNCHESTCDGECGEQHLHENLTMDPVTQLAYCPECVKRLSSEIRSRLDPAPGPP